MMSNASSPRAPLAAIAITLCLTGCSPSPPATQESVIIHASFPVYTNLTDIADESNLVAVVDIVSAVDDVLYPTYEGDDPLLNPYAGTDATPKPEEAGVPVTVYTAKINDVYAGDAERGDTIEIMQLGGTFEGITYTVDGQEELAIGDSLLTFLEVSDDGPASIVGGDAGAFAIENGDFVSIGDEKISVSPAELPNL